MICNYHCFEKNSEYYAIDTIRLIPLRLSKELYNTLLDLQQRRIKHIESLNDFEGSALEEIQLLSSENILIHIEKIDVNNSFYELSLSFIPTLSCNLNCKYCYSNRKYDNKEMEEETLKRTIAFFCDNFNFAFCRVDFVSGGEPLYNKPALRRMIDVISENLSLCNKDFFFWICSNGTLFDDEIIQYLDKKHCNIGISLDGPKAINDSNRVFKSGQGTYEYIVKGIHTIIENPNLSRNIKNLWNSAVITNNTNNLPDILKNSYKLGFKNLQMKLLWTNDKNLPNFAENMNKLYDELAIYLFELVKNDNIEQFLMICNENDSFGKILLRIIIQSGVVRRCNAGINKFSISPEGRIYPCDSFMGVDKYCLGDVFEGFNNLYYEFAKIRNYNITYCKSCWARNICGGDCMYNSYMNSGDPTIPDEKICNVIKHIIEICIKLTIDLYNCFPKKMQTIYNILAKRTVRMEPKQNEL